MKLIVGLGNPGRKYSQTRHNAGFRVVDIAAAKLGIDIKRKKFGGLIGGGEFMGHQLMFLKPQEFMNRSGQAVATAANFYRVELSDILVVVDDLALEPGRIRIKARGTAGGQKGLADVINKLGSDRFARLRVGIGQTPPGYETYGYVLGKPSGEDIELISQAEQRASEAVLSWIERGLDPTMNEFNAWATEQGNEENGSK